MERATAPPSLGGDHSQFTIGFDRRDRERVLEIWDGILSGQQWSEGEWTRRFEDAWGAWSGLPAVAFGSWTGGALAALDYAGVRGETVLCPSNTFMATPLAAIRAGASDEEIETIVRDAVWRKELKHHVGERGFRQPPRTMSAIGG